MLVGSSSRCSARYAATPRPTIIRWWSGARLGELDLLLSGDVEETAQQELGPIRADVLKVAHHGAATSDVEWLVDADASLAVISVGPNDFGHPSPEVVAALEASGARVARTDLDGDIVVRPP